MRICSIGERSKRLTDSMYLDSYKSIITNCKQTQVQERYRFPLGKNQLIATSCNLHYFSIVPS